MVLSDAIAAYVADRRAKGYASGTISNTQRILRHLLAAVGNIDTKSLRPQHVDAFWVRVGHWAPGTLNVARADLNAFFRWGQQRGYVRRDIDLMGGTRAFRVPDRNRIIIPQAEFAPFIEGAANPRVRVAVATGLYLFTRISETSALRWQDIDLDASRVEVYRKKTGKLDTLPICEELAHELRRWKLEYASQMGSAPAPGWYLIPGRAHGFRTGVSSDGFGFNPEQQHPPDPTVRPNMSRPIRDELVRAGYYQDREGGHTLRRSGAIALYDQLSSVGHDRAIRVVQAMLGHASIKTTEVYLRLDLDRKVRNDLLAGKPMFPNSETATIMEFRQEGR
jgi:integrase